VIPLRLIPVATAKLLIETFRHPLTDSVIVVHDGRVDVRQAEPAVTTDVAALREALDDLWGCIGEAEVRHLQPATQATASENHRLLWHDEAPK